jgi:proline iminopeptidase
MRNERAVRGAAERSAAPPHGHRVRRPVTPEGAETFVLTYVRTGPRNAPAVLVVPGGPGLASVLPYVSFRAHAARRGMQLIMVEHRGVGLSRFRDDGSDLPPAALTVEQVVADLAAVLDDCGIDRAVVYGSSYGSYLAQGFGLRHPDRVAGMVLDSPMLTARDVDVVRHHLRHLLWDGGHPDTAGAAAALRTLIADGTISAEEASTVVIVYEFAGPQVLERLLGALGRGRGHRTWTWLAGLATREVTQPVPYLIEPDLVGEIAYRELAYGTPPDGHPLDPQLAFVAGAERHPGYAGEPYDLPSSIGAFDWPTAVVSGGRDLRTPRPLAERIVDLVPAAVLVPLPGTGHSALDTHGLAALHVAHAVGDGGHRRLPQLAERIEALPRRGGSRWLGPLIRARVAAELALP